MSLKWIEGSMGGNNIEMINKWHDVLCTMSTFANEE